MDDLGPGFRADTFSEGVSPKSFLGRRFHVGKARIFGHLGYNLMSLPNELWQLWGEGSKKYSRHPSFLGNQVVKREESAKKVLSLAANSWQDFRKVNL
jgi:hypothetical protein